MPFLLTGVESPLESKREDIIAQALNELGLSGGNAEASIHKTSLDARRQENIRLVSSVFIDLKSVEAEEKVCEGTLKQRLRRVSPENDPILPPYAKEKGQVVVVGFGPAGMFGALLLAEFGYAPIVIERGESIEKRAEAVEGFWKGKGLNPESNVPFGEGGAGTFSDGKLTTRISDPLCGYVLKRLVEFGAPPEILTLARPHIGTDKLRGVVKTLRKRIEELGGQVRFNTKLEGLVMENGRIKGVRTVSGGVSEEIGASKVLLAIGHSASDTFKLLLDQGVTIEPKAFAVGARVEHLQSEVNRSLYGKNAENPLLPVGEYQMSWTYGAKTPKERGVYTFCMCPGGVVVPAASSEGGVVTNGMSWHARNLPNANAAVVVTVSPKDYGTGPLDGVMFAKSLEEKAFKLGGGGFKAPAVSVGNFLGGRGGITYGGVQGSYALGLKGVDFKELFPDFITEAMAGGLRVFGRRMDCFRDGRGLLTGPETRTSSPIRMTRNADGQAVGIEGLYPSGEGAGYAGGIISAAVDGLSAVVKMF